MYEIARQLVDSLGLDDVLLEQDLMRMLILPIPLRVLWSILKDSNCKGAVYSISIQVSVFEEGVDGVWREENMHALGTNKKTACSCYEGMGLDQVFPECTGDWYEESEGVAEKWDGVGELGKLEDLWLEGFFLEGW